MSPESILTRHHYIIQVRSVSQRFTMLFDDIQCWLCSVAKAQLVLQHQENQHRRVSRLHFMGTSDQSDGSYSPSQKSNDLDSITLNKLHLYHLDCTYIWEFVKQAHSLIKHSIIIIFHIQFHYTTSSSPPSVIYWNDVPPWPADCYVTKSLPPRSACALRSPSTVILTGWCDDIHASISHVICT
jgi:hypothetical protein